MKHDSYRDVILKVWFPAAIRYGIDYNTFWKLNPRIMNIYQDNYKKSLEEQQALMDANAWRNGLYQMAAIGAAMNKKNKYPKKPFGIKEKKKSGEEQFLLWCEEYNRRYEITENT